MVAVGTADVSGKEPSFCVVSVSDEDGCVALGYDPGSVDDASYVPADGSDASETACCC